MSLNIKTPETHILARELAAETGESMAQAVTEALRERLARVRSSRKTGLAERLLAIGRECAAHMSEYARTVDIDELLYDENGLPK
jgi:antitoxin VapB